MFLIQYVVIYPIKTGILFQSKEGGGEGGYYPLSIKMIEFSKFEEWNGGSNCEISVIKRYSGLCVLDNFIVFFILKMIEKAKSSVYI